MFKVPAEIELSVWISLFRGPPVQQLCSSQIRGKSAFASFTHLSQLTQRKCVPLIGCKLKQTCGFDMIRSYWISLKMKSMIKKVRKIHLSNWFTLCNRQAKKLDGFGNVRSHPIVSSQIDTCEIIAATGRSVVSANSIVLDCSC